APRRRLRVHARVRRRRKRAAPVEAAPMARKRRRTRLRPKTPARVKKAKRTRAAAPRSHHHPELWGLGLLVVGLFLGSVLYAGWDGGPVGDRAASGVRALVGSAAYAAPLAFAVVGALMVARSRLVDFRPFRIGLGVLVAGLLITLGADHGGYAGKALGGGLERLAGATGALLVGATGIVVGALLLSGASAGAILRRTGHVMRSAAATRRPRPRPAAATVGPPTALASPQPPVDAVHDFPDVVSTSQPPTLLVDQTEP